MVSFKTKIRNNWFEGDFKLKSKDPQSDLESRLYIKLEIRSVERGICPIATSTMNELFNINMAGCMAHARNGRISTSGLKSDVTVVFLVPDFLQEAEISAI